MPKIAFLEGKRACFTEDPGEAWDLGNPGPPRGVPIGGLESEGIEFRTSWNHYESEGIDFRTSWNHNGSE